VRAARFLPVACLAALAPLFASMEVQVDAEKIGQEDTLGVEVILEGEEAQPEIRSADFEMRGSSRSSQIQIINGAVSKRTIFHFDLGPMRTGSLSFSVAAGKETKGPVAIEVVAGRLKAPPAQARNPIEEFFGGNPWGAPQPQRRAEFGEDEAFVRNEVPKTQVWLGETFPVDTVLYHRVNLEQPRLAKEDEASGFSVEPVNDFQPQSARATLNGQNYQKVILRRRLFTPTLTGSATIKGAVLRLEKGGGFWGGPARNVKVPDLTLTVSPLPDAGKPATFRGAVGEFALKARLSAGTVKAHDAATLVYELSGQGNFRGTTLPAPSLRDPDLASRRAAVRDTVKFTAQGQEGTLAAEYMLIPEREKSYTLPGVEWSYFSPTKAAYVTLRTPTLTLTATKADKDGGPSVTINGSREVETQREDIRYIHTAGLRSASGGPFRSPWFIALHALSLLSAAGAFAVRRIHELRRHGGLGLASHALERALKRLKQCVKHRGDSDAFHRLLEAALQGYLQDRLGVSAGMPLTEVRRFAVAQFGESEELAGLFELVRACQAARYARPSEGGSDAGKSDRAETTLRAIDRLWGEKKGGKP